MDTIRRRMRHFMVSNLRQCPPERQREAVRNFALSLPAGLTLDQRHTYDLIFYDLMHSLLQGVLVVGELPRLFFNSMPGPDEYPLSRWRSRIKRFALKGLTGLSEGHHISIAIGRFLIPPGVQVSHLCLTN